MPSKFEQRYNRDAVPVLDREHAVPVVVAYGAMLTAWMYARRNGPQHLAMGQELGLDEAAIKVQERKFILPTSGLLWVVTGETFTPRTGMNVIEGELIDSEFKPSTRWTMMAPDDSTPPSEIQAGGYEWLVHTKRDA